MICYKDKTFCPFDKCADFSTCDRALIDQVYSDAVKWWGRDYPPPIAQYKQPPECYKAKK